MLDKVSEAEIAKISSQLDELAVQAPNPLLGVGGDGVPEDEDDDNNILSRSFGLVTRTPDGEGFSIRSALTALARARTDRQSSAHTVWLADTQACHGPPLWARASSRARHRWTLTGSTVCRSDCFQSRFAHSAPSALPPALPPLNPPQPPYRPP